MRKLELLIIMITMSCTAFSQTISLKPQVQQIEQDTVFCFTIPQSKAIAKALKELQYQDSIGGYWQTQSLKHLELLQLKNATILNLEQQIKNKNWIQSNHLMGMDILEETIAQQNEILRRNKRQKTWMGIGLGLLAFTAIAF